MCMHRYKHTHNTLPQAGKMHTSAQIPTIESRSMNGRGQADQQVLCWWKIWLLSTSAFLNTQSYLPSPQEERSFLSSFLLCIPVLSPLLISALPLCSSLFSCLIYLLSTSAFIYFPLSFLSSLFFPAFSSFSLFHYTPPSSSAPCRLPSLGGTAHSATKQSCLQHHTLANQARPEFSSPQIHSTAP